MIIVKDKFHNKHHEFEDVSNAVNFLFKNGFSLSEFEVYLKINIRNNEVSAIEKHIEFVETRINSEYIVNNESCIIWGTSNIGWMYPEIYDKSKRNSLTIELIHTRAAKGIHIEYDSERDGWIISNQTKFSWTIDDDICDPEYTEVAFIEG